MVKNVKSHNKGSEYYSLDVYSNLHKDKINGNNPIPGIEEVNSNSRTSYRFRKSLNRIVIRDQIKDLFDKNSRCRKSRIVSISNRYHTDIYAGKIDGINARIEFKNNAPCYIYAKTEKDFYKVYIKAVDRTIDEQDD